MNKNLGSFPKTKYLWMNIPKYFFILLFFFTSSSLAATYEEGKKAYLDQDYDLALEILKPLAKNGNAQAQITLGLMYDYGHGVEKSASESIKWYLMAAEQGVPLVQHDMGVKYFQGQGVEQNYDEAARWWEMSANAGVADSQFNLGLMYYRGIGIEKDYVKAAKLFEAAAEQGHGNAQYSLAVMYAFGQSKEKSYSTALNWFNKAAEQNVAQAQFNLGVFNENGYGLTKDLNKARNWYQLAANQGLQEAIEKLKTLPKQEAVTVAEEKSIETISEKPVVENNIVEPVAASTPASTNELNLSQWLRQQATDNYTIQLGSAVNEKDIIKYIQSSGLGSNAGYIEVIVNGITRYTAIYGLYDTYQKAELAVGDLPKAIQNTKPWVRNTGILQGLQKAIGKLKTLPKQEAVTVAEEKSIETISEKPVIESNTAEPVTTNPPASTNELNLSQWLRQQTADNYTIQLGSVVNEKDVIKYIQSSGLGSNAGYIEVIVNGITRYTAIYGLYDTHQKAELAVNELPKAIQNTKPWVRNTGILQGLLR